MDIRIDTDERAAFIGKTGSGKTELAKHFLKPYPYVVVLDNKGRYGTDKFTRKFTLANDGYVLCRDLDLLPEAARKSNKIVYRPDAAIEGNQKLFQEEMDAFFWWIYQRENCILYVDEVAAVCGSNFILPGHNAVIKRGRELNIGCWHGTQQPVNVNNAVFSEAEHFFLFRTQLESHREKLSGFMGDIVRDQIPGNMKYHFYYFNPENMDDAVLMSPVKI